MKGLKECCLKHRAHGIEYASDATVTRKNDVSDRDLGSIGAYEHGGRQSVIPSKRSQVYDG